MIDIHYFKSHIYDIIGAIHEVHNELGPGLKEGCYQEGLAIELKERNIIFQRENDFHPSYHGKIMSSTFRYDFLCKNDIIIECKAVSEIDNSNRAQLFNYLRILEKPCGILVNFAPPFAEIERYFFDKETRRILTVDGKTMNRFSFR